MILTIDGVYMPFYCENMQQTELYKETLDVIQDLVGHNAADSPMLIMGDFNASLPKSRHLISNWYKAKPFNRHSLLWYDFLCNNELVVSNFECIKKIIVPLHQDQMS